MAQTQFIRALLAALLLCLPTLARAQAVIMVGPGGVPTIAAAVAEAKDGATVLISPGDYFECAVWPQNKLTIRALPGGAVTLRGKACEGKAAFVLKGQDVLIDGLTFRSVRVPDRNGAGIRAEGGNLTIRNSHFVDVQMGLLTLDNPDATIRIEKSTFSNFTDCQPKLCHGIYVGEIKRLVVRDSDFTDIGEGHFLKSRARKTLVVGSRFIDDGLLGASYHVHAANGGDLILRDNLFKKGPLTSNFCCVVRIGGEKSTRPGVVTATGNTVLNRLKYRPTLFIKNDPGDPLRLDGNSFDGWVIESW